MPPVQTIASSDAHSKIILFERTRGIIMLEKHEPEAHNSYYYTFGSNPAFPYRNGWVVVKATSMEEANRKFRTRFPDRPGHEGIMNCAFYYDKKQWAEMDPEHSTVGSATGLSNKPSLPQSILSSMSAASSRGPEPGAS